MYLSKVVRKYLISGLFLVLSASVGTANTISIGYFDDTQGLSIGTGVNTGFNQDASPSDIGAHREFNLFRTNTGAGRILLDANDTPSFLTLSFPTAAQGHALITWDGPDANSSPWDPSSVDPAIQRGEPNTFGLGGIDITDGGRNSYLAFDATVDLPGASIVFYFYKQAGVYATATVALDAPLAPNVQLQYLVPFSGLTFTGPDLLNVLTDVNAVTMEIITTTNATDVSIDNFVAAGYVPEPGTFVLLSGALVGLAGLVRRRRSTAN